MYEIGESAFRQCTKLASVIIPSSVKKIGKQAFEGCYSLTTVEIPSGVTKIERDAFMNCPGINLNEIISKARKAEANVPEDESSLITKEYKLKVKVNGDVDDYMDGVVELSNKEVKQLVNLIIENDGETDVEEIELEEELPEIYEKLD